MSEMDFEVDKDRVHSEDIILKQLMNAYKAMAQSEGYIMGNGEALQKAKRAIDTELGQQMVDELCAKNSIIEEVEPNIYSNIKKTK